MRIMVTGSSGFIASHLTPLLVQSGHDVWGADIKWGRDVTDINGLSAYAEYCKPDIIFHLAAVLGPEHVYAQPGLIMAHNVTASISVSAVTLSHTIERLIFTSTSEVYGNCTDAVFDELTSAPTLGDMTNPRWSYAVSKLAGEVQALAVGGLVARIFNTSGPGQKEDYLIPRLVGQALRGDPLTIYGDGTQTRCFSHVSDTVAGLITLMDSEGASGIYNVGNDQEVTVLEVAEVVRQEVKPVDIQFLEPPPHATEMPHRRPALERLRGLGWEPKVDLKTLIRDVAQFQQGSQDNP